MKTLFHARTNLASKVVLLKNLRALALLLISTLFSSYAISAATTLHRWTGLGANGNWSTPANWVGNLVPTGGDQRIIFLAGSARKNNTNNLPAGTVFESIWIVDDGYDIRGNSVSTTLLRMDDATGTSTFRPDISPASALTIQVEMATARLIVGGDLVSPGTLTVTGLGNVSIQGSISGPGGLRKNNLGELALVGLGANSFQGPTLVNAGTLTLNRYLIFPNFQLRGVVAIPGNVTIGTGTNGPISDIVVLENDNQIANTASVAVLGTGRLNLNGNNDTIDELSMSGGQILTGSGELRTEGDIRILPAQDDSNIKGALHLGVANQRLLNIINTASLRIDAEVRGSNNTTLIKTNNGTLFLTASNTFAGTFDILDGLVEISDAHALGTAQGDTTLRSGTLSLKNIGTDPSETLTYVGPSGLLTLSGNSGSWNGSVVLENTLLIRVPSNAGMSITGKITGPEGYWKYGPGTLTLKTTYTHDYQGVTRLLEGDMVLDGVFHQPVIPGPFIVGVTNRPPGSENVIAIKNNQFTPSAPITIRSSGSLTLGSTTHTVGPLTLEGGVITTSNSGLLTLNGDVLSLSSPQLAFIDGRLNLGTASRVFEIAQGPLNVDMKIAAIMGGGSSVQITKRGAGTMEWSGANIFEGDVVVEQGQLRTTHANALGTSNRGTRVNGGTGGRFGVANNIKLAEPLVLDGANALPTSGVLLNVESTNEISGPITLASPTSIAVFGAQGQLTLSGSLQGPSGFTKAGPKTLILAGATPNTYQGTTTLTEGFMLLSKPNGIISIPADLIVGEDSGAHLEDVVRNTASGQISPQSAVTIRASGGLDLSGGLASAGSLEGIGYLDLGGSFLTVGGNNLSRTFSGILTNHPNANGMRKVGTGVQSFTADNPFHNLLNVEEGGIIIYGKQANTVIRAQAGSFFGGNGEVLIAETQPGSSLRPGASPGKFTARQNLLLTSGTLQMELNGNTPGTTYDQVIVEQTGQLGAELNLKLGFSPVVGQTFVLIQKNSAGPLTGTFKNLSEGSTISVQGTAFQISYVGGDGNDVVLTTLTPSLSSTTWTTPSPGQLQVQATGTPGVAYVLEATGTLNLPLLWTPVVTNTADASGLIQYLESDTTNFPQRYYRWRTTP